MTPERPAPPPLRPVAAGGERGVLSSIRTGIRDAGLWLVAPWAFVVTALQFVATSFAAAAALAGPTGFGGILFACVAYLSALGGGIVALVIGLSGTVFLPPRRAFAGLACGIAGALCVCVATFGGLAGLGAPASADALFVVGAVAAGLAVVLAAAWARLRFRAGAPGMAAAAGVTALLAVVPLLLHGLP